MEKPLKGALVYGQSGGPTAVINSSFLGVIEEAKKHPEITCVLGAQQGIRGIINDVLFDISKEDSTELTLLKNTPSAALGSARYKLAEPEADKTDYEKILATFKKHNVRYFMYNGGNDSMDTCNKVSRYLKSVNYECCVIGIPKTIDNDLAGTDYCPGYGSAAKFIATACQEISLDSSIYGKESVVILEIMGRNAGWLAAAAALAGSEHVDLVYLPEVPFNMDEFVSDIKELFLKKKNIIVAVSEGIKDDKGRYIAEYWEANTATAADFGDGFNHKQLGGVGSYLTQVVKERTKAKVRAIEFSLLQRCAAHISSKTDMQEAYAAGQFAVQSAINGKSGFMVAFKRVEGKDFKQATVLAPLETTANAERKVPAGMINKKGNNVTQAFIDYARPLITGENFPPFEDGMPKFARLKLIKK